MKYFISALLLLGYGSCIKSKVPDAYLVVAIIHFEDSTGADLFRDGSNGYHADSVRLYYMLNGVRTMVNNARPGFIPAIPYGVSANVTQPGDSSQLGIETDYNIIHDSSTIFVDLKPGKEDTLTCVFTQFDHFLTLAWYDEVPEMTAADQYNNYFTVREK